MIRHYIPVEEAARDWFKDPEFRAAYDALDEEFALAEALIKARTAAAMTQADVAKAMGTTQAVVARLESGRTMPSTRTLQRFAKATGNRLRISFAPAKTAPVER
ncbi:helix-turn-helix domain-containing protein [Labrys wisconsinensis]|uniref:Ribosome-binding protein aMBF1 (Putative translation factor) n=1 Tax=Labrys wisconsinensis TaxID=425677 RepID=A0ABU0J854_9HYPH|nr:helix-turn-helix transcriptional regulator [Labrys wisconsinensis]MDQ0470457.1 ribosome-binding protein aMBF1 (putative translation factor) [Labrys wisconsinensis]